MQESIALVTTPNGSSYLRKLCQHWSHKFEVSYTDQDGTIQLPGATCVLHATADVLEVRLSVQPQDDEARMQRIVEEHLQRFGFREELTFVWTPIPTTTQA